MLLGSRKSKIRKGVLRLVVNHTASKRGSTEMLKEYEEICEE